MHECDHQHCKVFTRSLQSALRVRESLSKHWRQRGVRIANEKFPRNQPMLMGDFQILYTEKHQVLFLLVA